MYVLYVCYLGKSNEPATSRLSAGIDENGVTKTKGEMSAIDS